MLFDSTIQYGQDMIELRHKPSTCGRLASTLSEYFHHRIKVASKKLEEKTLTLSKWQKIPWGTSLKISQHFSINPFGQDIFS